MNKKILFVLFFILIIAPFLVLADSYDGPYCYEDPNDFNYRTYNDDPRHIRGTCKEIEIFTVVSLDPALKKDYLLGEHSPVCLYPDRYCADWSKYSEEVSFSGTNEIKQQSSGIEDNSFNIAIFDKQFFLSKLASMFKKENIPFNENNIPNISISILKKDEIAQNEHAISLLETKMDSPKKGKIYGEDDDKEAYIISTIDYLEYGKHIYAPKGELVELQYADIKKGKNMLNNKDLGITSESYGKGGRTAIVALTSPLKSATNYWMYTKINGKITLAWQKSEYALDSGKVKTITENDKNVSAALLFSNSSNEEKPSASNNSPVVEQPVVQKKGFFSRILDTILSWFK